MARTKTQKGVDQVHEPRATFSLKEAATAIGRSRTTTKRYKALIAKVFSEHTEVVFDEAGSFTQKGFDELLIVRDMFANGTSDEYEKDARKRHSGLGPQAGHGPGPLPTGQSFQSEEVEAEIVDDEPRPMALAHSLKARPAISLTNIRGETFQIGDLDTALTIADEIIGGIKEAVDDDLAAQEAEIGRTEAAAKELRGKLLDLETVKQLHARRTARLQVKQKIATEELQEALEEVQR